MSKQKEDVLLMVKHVRYKKVDGTLYINSGRVAWRNQTSDTFRISAPFEDIRVQRISPDQKEKVQLQLLMHNGESFTFHFSDPGGRYKQLEMRNSVKEMLQSLLPKFKDKAHSELREKFRLLESNPDILALYKELVVTGILTSDEFWNRPEFSNTTLNATSNAISHTTPQPNSDSRSSSLGQSGTNATTQSHASGQISRSFQLEDKPQAVGVPSYLLSDIKPEADGTNGIKYSLTHETIDAIFRAYPTVRQRHRELVPDKLSETDFWVKFFQSHYFHRDRAHLPKEDIFADCANLDERYLQNEVRRSRRSRISAHLDLDSLSDHDIGSGYGLDCAPSSSVSVSSVTSNDRTNFSGSTTAVTQSSQLSANQLLLRRFNNHSILVLKSLGATDIASGLAPVDSVPHSVATNSETTSQAPATIKDRIYTPELNKGVESPPIHLELTSVQDYFQGPVSREQSTSERTVSGTLQQPARHSAQQPYSSEQLEQALNRCKSSMQAAYQSNKGIRAPVLTPVEAQIALADVSPGGCLLGGKNIAGLIKSTHRASTNSTDGGVSRTRIDRTVSGTSTSMRESTATTEEVDHGPALLTPDQSRELNLLYASACELLRHFWACFPVTNQQLIEKLERIAGSLSRFRATKVAHFVASIEQSTGGSSCNNAGGGGTGAGGGGSSKPDCTVTHSSTGSDTINRNAVGSLAYRSRVTAHLESMLDAAQQRYTEWKALQKR